MPDEIKKEATPVVSEEQDAAEISDKDLDHVSGGARSFQR